MGNLELGFELLKLTEDEQLHLMLIRALLGTLTAAFLKHPANSHAFITQFGFEGLVEMVSNAGIGQESCMVVWLLWIVVCFFRDRGRRKKNGKEMIHEYRHMEINLCASPSKLQSFWDNWEVRKPS